MGVDGCATRSTPDPHTHWDADRAANDRVADVAESDWQRAVGMGQIDAGTGGATVGVDRPHASRGEVSSNVDDAADDSDLPADRTVEGDDVAVFAGADCERRVGELDLDRLRA